MMAFLHWIRDVVVGMLNGVVKFALFLVALFIVLAAIGLMHGDGLPGNMVLGLDLRAPMQDSAAQSPFDIGGHALTVMDVVLGLDAAGRDARVKGLYLRVGSADISVAQAEELGAALKRFRATGKFVIAHSQGFLSAGLGDYLTAANADQIWMQPNSPFSAAGSGAGAIFLRGLFDKIQAEPQIVKRSDYKSAADMFMEKDYTAPDREQTTALLTSFYNDGTAAVASDRKLNQKSVQATFEASPQSAENAMKAGLIDKTGYDDDALAAALSRAGDGAKAENFATFARTTEDHERYNHSGNIALIEASGDIVDGSAGGMFGGSAGIAGDDLSRAIRTATKDKAIKVILLRVDSPGGSVTASDQILDAVKKAQSAGKPVVISMGSVAASGGYYIACSAAKIVAEPATITGSIGVLTGKISFGKSLGLIGVTADQIGVGKNALIDSEISPFTPEQLAAINAQADAIYADFTQKVAAGRKIPLAQVQNIAKGRVWSGTDAHARGLVDDLGGFWVAAADAQKLAGDPADAPIELRRYPHPTGFFEALGSMFGGSSASLRAMQGMVTLFNSPVAQALVQAANTAPHADVELRATNLPGH